MSINQTIMKCQMVKGTNTLLFTAYFCKQQRMSTNSTYFETKQTELELKTVQKINFDSKNSLKMGKIKSNSLKSVRQVLKPYETVFNGDKEPLKTKIIDSPFGPLVLVSDEKSILMLKTADSPTLNRELKHLTKLYSKPIIETDESEPLKSIESELNAYFKGDLTEFQTSFDINTSGTEFQRAVWNEIYKIKHGKTSTYLELAQRIGKPKSYRAVANACGRNPIAIVIPCHRILASGGGLGGYTGGVDKKEWLLDHEK